MDAMFLGENGADLRRIKKRGRISGLFARVAYAAAAITTRS